MLTSVTDNAHAQFYEIGITFTKRDILREASIHRTNVKSQTNV